MMLSKKFNLLLLVICLANNGCIAAVPVVQAVAMGLTMANVGHSLASVTRWAISSAKAKHTGVDFDKRWPDCIAFDKNYDTLYQLCNQAIIELNEQFDKTDKDNGIIETKRAPFGDPQISKEDSSKKVFFWQEKLLKISKSGDNQAQVCITVILFSTIGETGLEKPLKDEAGENVVKAIFFDKLEKLINQ